MVANSEEDTQAELEIIREVRAAKALPAAAQLPAPDPDMLEEGAGPSLPIDANGYEMRGCDLGHLCHLAAFHLDKIFSPKPEPQVSVVPQYGEMSRGQMSARGPKPPATPPTQFSARVAKARR